MESENFSIDSFKDRARNFNVYHYFLNNLQDLGRESSDLSLIDMNDTLLNKMFNSSSFKRLSNKIIDNHCELDKSKIISTAYLMKLHSSWQRKLIKSVNSICTEHSIPLSKKRTQSDGNEIKKLWNELGTNISEHILSANKCSNLSDMVNQSMTGALSIPLSISSLEQLKKVFKEVSVNNFQSGFDDPINIQNEFERFKIGKKVMELNDSLLTSQFAKQGCSRGLRAKFWAQILNVHPDPKNILYYNYLKKSVLEDDLLIDSIYYKDVKSIAVNDDQVFVFEDLLYQVLLIFSRDTHVLNCFTTNRIQIPKAYVKTNEKNGALKNEQYYQVNYPPNGFLPFEGFSLLVAPICYVFSDPIHLYFIFRKFFMKYFYKLTIISSDPQSIMGLCALFENLLSCRDPKLFNHLQKLEFQSTQIVFKWLIKCFSGYLASSQLLELWDRVLAFDSLEILAVFAVGVFVYRRENLLLCVNKTNIESVLEDLTSVKIVPILQLILL